MKVILSPCLTVLPFLPRGTGRCERGCRSASSGTCRIWDVPRCKPISSAWTTDGAAERETRRLMDVSISRFFRDGPLWRILETEILPSLIAEHTGGLRVWSGGCALGQEIYSFRILWALLADKTAAMPPLELWATDVNPAYLERAIEGIYPAGTLARVPAGASTRFFRPVGRASFRVADEFRAGISWQVRDLTADPPPARDFHIVFLRNNLLTYYRDDIVKAALPAIRTALCREEFSSSAGRSICPVS